MIWQNTPYFLKKNFLRQKKKDDHIKWHEKLVNRNLAVRVLFIKFIKDAINVCIFSIPFLCFYLRDIFFREGREYCCFLIRVNYAICRYVLWNKKRKKEHGKKDHQFSALKEEKIESHNYKLSNYTVYFRICH